ncbi:ABC transporter ATP-binding protein [Streptomyces sp. NPDC020875]|uniref:ABC transporter ATP-binding protein n=1 Tax=Streptomyces sp. NPDC020875 TaxID=3154898 RepID=UPI0033E3809F
MSGPRMMTAGSAERSMDFKGSGRRLLRQLAPDRALLWMMLGAAVLSVALSVVGPWVLGRATDLVFAGVVGRSVSGDDKAGVIAELRAKGDDGLADMLSGVDFTPGQGIDFTAVGQVLLVALALFLLSGLLALVATRCSIKVINRAVYRMREDVQAKLERLPLSYFDRAKRGEVLSRVTNDIDNVAQTLQQTMGQLINSLLTIVGVLVMMFWISPLLALVALVTVPLSVVVATRVGKRSQPHFVQQWRTTGKLNAHVEEMYTGHALVKVFGRQRESAREFAEQNDALYEAGFKAQFHSGVMQPLMFFISNLNYVLVAVVGGLRVASGSLSIGDVQAFVQYSRQFSMPLTQVASMANLVQSGVASAERVFELLDAEEQTPDAAAVVLVKPGPGSGPGSGSGGGSVAVPVAGGGTDGAAVRRAAGRVELERVSFRYEPDKPLIEELSLGVEPGQTVAIVGPTGAGKTTLVNLLMRFYEVTGGRISVDGVDIATLPRDELRSGIGMVLQDTWLFGGTIAENIAYGAARDVTRAEIEEAARAAHADRFVRTLPDGYDTVIDDDGAGVSAGEKQLITIARAFLSDPVILVLDEATSSVDTRTEVLIQKAMARLSKGRTSFVIAHRLSTIRDADVILVMENGSIVEQGTHAALLAAEGAYARLYSAQFAQAVAEVD